MVADLKQWVADLAKEAVSSATIAEKIGSISKGADATQLTVVPRDDAWSQAEIVARPGDSAPTFVRLVCRDPEGLRVDALDSAFGSPSTLPPRVHFDDPETRIYEVDTGEPAHTAAVIAELVLGSDTAVSAVVLRRDIRLD